MTIRDIMTREPATCSPSTNAAEAGSVMLHADCGILPVVDEEGRLTGIVTDRDLFIALATRNVRASDLAVGDVARPHVLTCAPGDDVHAALATMKAHQVRRLPVTDAAGMVVGVISMNDILRTAGPRKLVRNDEVVDTFQSICARHALVPAA